MKTLNKWFLSSTLGLICPRQLVHAEAGVGGDFTANRQEVGQLWFVASNCLRRVGFENHQLFSIARRRKRLGVFVQVIILCAEVEATTFLVERGSIEILHGLVN